ncbi:MAG: FkbM family methyltransferase [Methylovulum miyakonense]|uniref:FkbM family methyltransferase n=1 Tax=Methylovulum miyakonense TaxID=645578 RepID=UPI003BB6D0C6
MKKYDRYNSIKFRIVKVLRFIYKLRCFRYNLHNSNVNFILHPKNNLSELIYIGKTYEPIETKFCKNYISEGDIVFDIGANIGYFTTIFSHKVGKNGKVIAFEPGFQTFALLCRTIEALRLDNAIACPFAVWDKSEILSFNNSTSGDDAQQSFGERDKFLGNTYASPVSAISGNDLLNSEYFRNIGLPSFIKIDVEGVEPQVLEGFSDILSVSNENPPVLLVECNTEALLACNNLPHHIMDILSSIYDLYYNELQWPVWFTNSTNFVRLESLKDEDILPEINILAVPKKGCFRERALKALEIQ